MVLYYLLIFILPLSQHPVWERSVGELTVTKYIGAACLLYAILHVGARRALPPFFRAWQSRALALLVLIAAVSYFTRDMQFTFGEMNPFLSYVSFLLLFFVTLSVVDSVERLHRVILVAVASAAFASLHVLREWQKYHALYRDFRPGWVAGDANYFSVSALLALPLGYYLAFGPRAPSLASSRRSVVWERLFCVGCLVLTLAAFMLAASRGGFLGLLAVFSHVIWSSRRRARNLALAAVLTIPLILVSPASPLHRFLRPDRSDKEAVQNRTTVWKAGLRMIDAHPLAGVGLGNFKHLVRGYEQGRPTVESLAHNSYIEIAVEMGLPTVFVFLAILVGSFRTLEKVKMLASDLGSAFLHQTALGLQAALVGCSVSIFFVSGQYQKSLWLIVFLSMCLPQLAARMASKRTAEETGHVGARSLRVRPLSPLGQEL